MKALQRALMVFLFVPVFTFQVYAGDRPWTLGFTEPYFMSVWVEDSSAVDRTGTLYRSIARGGATGGEPENIKNAGEGWHGVGSKEMPVTGADLPMRIYVRWQSLVERKTYSAWVELPDNARQVMEDALKKPCPSIPLLAGLEPVASVQLGLAPGGVIQVWVRDECRRPIKVARGQATLEPLKDGDGESNNYPELSERSKRYVKEHGIPFGSW